jgi:chromate transport protein ChrA
MDWLNAMLQFQRMDAISTGFIGYLVAGFGGAVVAAIATFLPCYLITVLAAPYFHYL